MADRQAGAQRRAAERERRRSRVEGRDVEAPPDADVDGGGTGIHAGDAARAAAAAALAGAAAGAFKALTARNDSDHVQASDEAEEVEQPGQPDDSEEPDRGEEVEGGASERPEPEPVEAEPRRGADSGSVSWIVRAARQHLRELHGSEAESVSSLEQAPSGWAVTLEVVELRRIPDSTDVLATYRVELDRDGQLVRYERTGRYYRAHADRGDAG